MKTGTHDEWELCTLSSVNTKVIGKNKSGADDVEISLEFLDEKTKKLTFLIFFIEDSTKRNDTIENFELVVLEVKGLISRLSGFDTAVPTTKIIAHKLFEKYVIEED